MPIQFVFSGQKEAVLPLFAHRLLEAVRHEETINEAGLYSVENNVVYLAETIYTSFTVPRIDLDHPDYWVCQSEDDMVVETMNPVRAQSIADKIVLSLWFFARYPAGHSERSGIRLGQKMYHAASISHPDSSLRPALFSLSLAFPVWAKALPRLHRKVSLVL